MINSLDFRKADFVKLRRKNRYNYMAWVPEREMSKRFRILSKRQFLPHDYKWGKRRRTQRNQHGYTEDSVMSSDFRSHEQKIDRGAHDWG